MKENMCDNIKRSIIHVIGKFQAIILSKDFTSIHMAWKFPNLGEDKVNIFNKFRKPLNKIK